MVQLVPFFEACSKIIPNSKMAEIRRSHYFDKSYLYSTAFLCLVCSTMGWNKICAYLELHFHNTLLENLQRKFMAGDNFTMAKFEIWNIVSGKTISIRNGKNKIAFANGYFLPSQSGKMLLQEWFQPHFIVNFYGKYGTFWCTKMWI